MPKRVVEMDVARALAAAAVVVIHVAQGVGGVNNDSSSLRLALYVAARFAVPVFVMLSGMGMVLSKGPDGHYLLWLKRRVGKIAFGYIIWTLVYTLLFSHGILGKPHLVTPATLAMNLVTGASCYHLYFIPRIIGLYILYPFIGKWIRTGWGVLVAFTLAAALTPIFRHLDAHGSMFALSLLSGPIRWLPYLAVGAWMGSSDKVGIIKQPTYGRIALTVLLLCMAAIIPVSLAVARSGSGVHAVFPLLKILVAPYSVALVAWIWSRQWSPGKIVDTLQFISKRSYGVYLSHPLVLSVFGLMLPHAKWARNCPAALFIVIAFTFGMLGSLAVTACGDYIQSRVYASA